jgi:SOS-response transcriptional repressor LexA
MKHTRISQILKKLMSEKNLRTAELARLTQLAQPTLHRIVTGLCEHPHHTSLKPIADFFGITVDQLKGLSPLPSAYPIQTVPLLRWTDLPAWLDQSTHPIKGEISDKQVLTSTAVSATAYALEVEDAAMEPIFPQQTVLIVDPQKPPKDRSYVIAHLQSGPRPSTVFRQLIMDVADYYLKPLSPDLDRYRMTLLQHNDRLCGVVVQTQKNYE